MTKPSESEPVTPWTCPACCRTENGGHKVHTRCPRGNSQDDSDDRPAPVQALSENPARSARRQNAKPTTRHPDGRQAFASVSFLTHVPLPAGHVKAPAGASTPPGRGQSVPNLPNGASGMFILPRNPDPAPWGC